MKSFYMAWNKENVDDEVILQHLEQMSNYQIKLDLAEVKENRLLELQVRPPQRSHSTPRSSNNNPRRKGSSSNNNNNRRRR
jgi:hypothetical protein